MKTYNLIILVLISFFLISCEDFLTKQPANIQSIENSYNTEEDIDYAVVGCYNELITLKNCSEFLFNENRSDNAHYPNTENITSNSEAYFPALLMVPVASDYVEPYWRQCYVLLNRINLIMKNIDKVSNETKRKGYIAQVLFLRGWCYFNMVRYFGGVPITTAPFSSGSEAYNVARKTKEETYYQVISDLKTSIAFFEELGKNYTYTYGRVHQWTAKALLGKVYLTLGDKTNALTYLEDVYKNSKFKLTSNYQDLFVPTLETTKGAEEVLFPIRFTGGGLGLGCKFSTLMAATSISLYGSNIVFWSNSLREAFTRTTDVTKDTRYSITCADVPGTTTVQRDYPKRYAPKAVGLVAGTYETIQLSASNDGDTDWLELRFADVVLMLAEVKGKTEGLDLLNEVRKRAKAPEYTADDINTLFDGNFQEAVLNERRLELAFENDRFFDLCRMGDDYATQTLFKFYRSEPPYEPDYVMSHEFMMQLTYGEKIDAWRLLLPIPYNEILRSNALKQNPGYSVE